MSPLNPLVPSNRSQIPRTAVRFALESLRSPQPLTNDRVPLQLPRSPGCPPALQRSALREDEAHEARARSALRQLHWKPLMTHSIPLARSEKHPPRRARYPPTRPRHLPRKNRLLDAVPSRPRLSLPPPAGPVPQIRSAWKRMAAVSEGLRPYNRRPMWRDRSDSRNPV